MAGRLNPAMMAALMMAGGASGAFDSPRYVEPLPPAPRNLAHDQARLAKAEAKRQRKYEAALRSGCALTSGKRSKKAKVSR